MQKQVKSSKLILGLAAVFLAHIGFVFYIATDRPSETATETAGIGGVDYPVTEPLNGLSPGSQPGDENAAPASSQDPPARLVIDRSPERRRGVTRPGTRQANIDRRLSTTPDRRYPTDLYSMRKPVRVRAEASYSAKKAFDGKRELQAAKKPERSEKKSFMARVVPILKKPYDWLKAVGSRLK
jgi:hypothetical protein